MRWLHLAEVLELHRRLIQQSGGISGPRSGLAGGLTGPAPPERRI
jgi:hypothetical protein